MDFHLQDCYARFDDHSLIIGNRFIERGFSLREGKICSDFLKNKETDNTWQGHSGSGVSTFHFPFWKSNTSQWKISCTTDDDEGLVAEHLKVTVELETPEASLRLQLRVYPNSPFIYSQLSVKGQSSIEAHHSAATAKRYDNIETDTEANKKPEVKLPVIDTVDTLNLNRRHIKLSSYRFHDVTDHFDHLVEETHTTAFHRRYTEHAGNAFIIDDYLQGDGILLVKEGPTVEGSLQRTQPELRIHPSESIQMCGSGLDYTALSSEAYHHCYGWSVGVGSPSKLPSLYRDYYRKTWTQQPFQRPVIYSNTWGDRNQDAAISEDTIRAEIEAAHEMGIEHVCIDDGWQTGITSNSKVAQGGVWEGYYAKQEDFWDINAEKFPRGFQTVVDFAKSKNVSLQLWFSPDSSNDFCHWKKDADVLLNLWKQHGVTIFKLDGIKIRNKTCELNLNHLLRALHRESNGRILPALDCTAEVRYGYFYEKQHGILFLENRYTDWGNYYPHNTLKNLWLLSRWIPAQRLQIEILNHRRNPHIYGDDPLAPERYSIQYLYAITMMANPLFWMELRNLPTEEREALKPLIALHKSIGSDLYKADIQPIGPCPDGISFTGFHAATNEQRGYVIVFREFAEQDSHAFSISGLSSSEKEHFQYLTSSAKETDFEWSVQKDALKVSFRKEASFLLLSYDTAKHTT